MTEELDDEARERADAVREKRHDRTDPEDRVRRVHAQSDPPDDLDLDRAAAGDAPDLPDPVRQEFEETRKKVAYGLDQEFGVDLDPDDQYWPLVVHLGVERVKGMWLEEVRRALAETDGVDPPE